MTAHDLRREAAKRIKALTPERLAVAVDFLGYLEGCEDNAATRELLAIPGFRKAFSRAARDVAAGRSRNWRKVRADV